MKDNINFQPFYIGQRVVCVYECSKGGRTKGHVYTVKALHRCKCGIWTIDIGDTGELARVRCDCGDTGTKPTIIEWHHASAFAPIESTFSAITLSEVIEIETPLICNN